jgi:endonuclease G, mitochondrial
VGQSIPSARDAHGAAHHFTLDATQQARVDANCFGGLPVDTLGDVGPTELIARQGYVLEHSDVDKIPLWVCESVTAGQLSGHVARRNQFKADPDIKGSKAYPGDYAGSGYDRGHQAPAGNQTRDPELKDQTFYMSNMAPQRPSLNRGIWKLLEDRTRAWVTRYGYAYEWTGPIRCVPHSERPLARAAIRSAAAESCERRTIGRNEIAVPLYFYKIVLVPDQSAWRAIAFVLPNTDFKPPYRLESYIKSIDWIEQQTGIEFMPNIALHERRALKSGVASMWP